MKFALALAVIPLAACSTFSAKDISSVDAKAQFERLKTLDGKWTGDATHGGQPAGKVDVVYHVTAAGSAIEEKLFAGTEHEMITMYHMDGDSLMLEHYCAAGNQPHMVAHWDPNMDNIRFLCAAGGTNMKSESDMHMHSGVIHFVDKDHLEETWSGLDGGKPAGDAHFVLERAK